MNNTLDVATTRVSTAVVTAEVDRGEERRRGVREGNGGR